MFRSNRDEDESLALLGAPLLSPDDRSNVTAPLEQRNEDDSHDNANGHPNSSSKSKYDQTHGHMPGVSVGVGTKAFFSNERTFLSWMSMAVTLSAISVSVLA